MAVVLDILAIIKAGTFIKGEFARVTSSLDLPVLSASCASESATIETQAIGLNI